MSALWLKQFAEHCCSVSEGCAAVLWGLFGLQTWSQSGSALSSKLWSGGDVIQLISERQQPTDFSKVVFVFIRRCEVCVCVCV